MSTVTAKQKILTGTGLVNQTSDPIMIDLRRFHFGITIACTVVGTAAYKVQVSFDPQESAPVYWNDHDLLVGLTGSANSNLAFPATFVRLVAASMSGSLVLSVVSSIGTS